MMHATSCLSVLLLVAFGVTYTAAQQHVFRIGSVYPITERFASISRLIRNGQQMWKDTVNARGGLLINGTSYQVEIIERGAEGTPNAVANATRSVIQDDNANFVLLPITSRLGIPGAVAANDLKINSLLPASSVPSNYICGNDLRYPCKTPFGRRFKYATSLVLPTVQFAVEALNLLAIHNAKTIAVYWEDTEFTKSVAEGAIRSVEFLGMELVYSGSIKFSSNATLVQPDIDNLIGILQDKKPDVVIAGTFFSCQAFMDTARKMNFNAKAYLLSRPCGLTIKGENGKYVMVSGGNWDKRLRSDRYDEPPEKNLRYHHFVSNGSTPSVTLFNDKYKSVFGVEPGYDGMVGYTQGYIIQYALETANSLDSDEIQNVINAMDLSGFCGEFEFDQFGQNLGRSGLTQQIDENLESQLVAPLFAVTKQFVYPVPKWDERETTYGWYKYTSEIAILSVVCVVIVVTFALMIWVLLYRSHRVIRAAQPLFVVLTLFGTIMMYCSVFFWTLHTDDLHCNLVRWLLAVGFGLTYGAMFARVYRIGQIFLVKTLDVFKVTNMMIVPIVAAVVTIEIVILVLWTAISTGRAELVEGAPFVLSDNYFTCSNTTKDTIFFTILMVFNVGVLLYGLYWIYRIWRLKAVLYNESRHIGFAVYTLTFFIIIIIIIQVFGNANREVAFILRSLCLVLGPFISVLLLLVPRMVYMTMTEAELDSGAHTTGSMNVGSTGSANHAGESELQHKVDMLQKRVAELEGQLKKKTKKKKQSRGPGR